MTKYKSKKLFALYTAFVEKKVLFVEKRLTVYCFFVSLQQE